MIYGQAEQLLEVKENYYNILLIYQYFFIFLFNRKIEIMAFKDKEKEKVYRTYWEKHIRSEESKRRKKETTRLWILNQRKKKN